MAETAHLGRPVGLRACAPSSLIHSLHSFILLKYRLGVHFYNYIVPLGHNESIRISRTSSYDVTESHSPVFCFAVDIFENFVHEFIYGSNYFGLL